jgi:putative lumazine-binding protein
MDEAGSSAEDQTGITGTLLDYFEGWFDADPSRIASALHPDLAKRGVRDGESGPQLASMTTVEMVRWTREGDGAKERPTDLEIRVDVLDVYRDIATAVVRSTVYIEYCHLLRTPDGWRVVNTLYMRSNQSS